MEILSIVIAVLVFGMLVGFITWSAKFFSYVFPGTWVAIFLVVIGVCCIKFIIGRK